MRIRSIDNYKEFQGVEILKKKSFVDERGEFIKLYEAKDSCDLINIKQIHSIIEYIAWSPIVFQFESTKLLLL